MYPSKWRFSRGTLQTEGYERFPRMPCKTAKMSSTAAKEVHKCKYFLNEYSLENVIKPFLVYFNVVTMCSRRFPRKTHPRKKLLVTEAPRQHRCPIYIHRWSILIALGDTTYRNFTHKSNMLALACNSIEVVHTNCDNPCQNVTLVYEIMRSQLSLCVIHPGTPDETRRLIKFRADNEQRFLKSKAAAKQLWEWVF